MSIELTDDELEPGGYCSRCGDQSAVFLHEKPEGNYQECMNCRDWRIAPNGNEFGINFGKPSTRELTGVDLNGRNRRLGAEHFDGSDLNGTRFRDHDLNGFSRHPKKKKVGFYEELGWK